MSPTVVIPIRAGSKGLPGKNIRMLAGMPLFMHSVACARAAGIDDIVVATDIEDVLQSADHQFRVYRRSPESATDTAPTHDVLIEVISALGLEDRMIVLLQATSPLRRPETVRKVISLFKAGAFDVCCSVSEIDNTLLKAGLVNGESIVPLLSAKAQFSPRQELPRSYKMDGGTFVFSGAWLLERGNLETDRIGVVISGSEEFGDIDDMSDFNRVEQFILNG